MTDWLKEAYIEIARLNCPGSTGAIGDALHVIAKLQAQQILAGEWAACEAMSGAPFEVRMS